MWPITTVKHGGDRPGSWWRPSRSVDNVIKSYANLFVWIKKEEEREIGRGERGRKRERMTDREILK